VGVAVRQSPLEPGKRSRRGGGGRRFEQLVDLLE